MCDYLISINVTVSLFYFATSSVKCLLPGPDVIKLFSTLYSAEHEIFPLIYVKMPTVVDILTFMKRENRILGLSEPENY